MDESEPVGKAYERPSGCSAGRMMGNVDLGAVFELFESAKMRLGCPAKRSQRKLIGLSSWVEYPQLRGLLKAAEAERYCQ